MEQDLTLGGTIRQTTVLQDFNKPMIARNTRWNYMANYFPLWKELIRFHVYIYLLVGIALYFVTVTPLISIVALAAAAYFFQIVRHLEHRLASSRKIMIGH